MASKVVWSPYPLGPPKFNVQTRLEDIRGFLDPKSPRYREGQRDNIRAAIRAYESGEIDGSEVVWFAGGKLVSEETTIEFAVKKRGHITP